MESIENVSKQAADSENRLSHFGFNYEQNSMQNDSFLKVNGDHNVPQHIFPSDDESTTSSHSLSSSPRNLVIDHQEENSKECHDEKVALQGQQDVAVAQQNLLPHSSNGDVSSSNEKHHAIKRKLSLRDTAKPPHLPKKRRFSTKSADIDLSDRNLAGSDGGYVEQRAEPNSRNSDPSVLPTAKGTGPFREYAQYLGLKPTTIPIKCFKCSNSNFENLNQLRDHQKICLFKDKQRNVACNSTGLKNSENRSNELVNSNSLDMLNSSLPKPKQGVSSSGPNTSARAKKRVFLCSACGTYYENWNLFLHMREVHKRHICLYCIGMFPSAERLTFHLEMKHDLEQNHFDCQEKLLRSSRDSCYLMCCVCEHLFTEHEDFPDHRCSDHQQPCSICGQKGRHSLNCKAGPQLNKAKHKDSEKRKNKSAGNSFSFGSLELDLKLDKAFDPLLNGNEKSDAETSILRRIITDRRLNPTRNEGELPSSLKLNGCAEKKSNLPVENNCYAISRENLAHPTDNTSERDANTNANCEEKLDNTTNLPNDNHESHPVTVGGVNREECKVDDSFNSSLSQSNTTSELTLRSHSSPEKELNDTVKSFEISQSLEHTTEPKPLLVPKFKIRIPKEFQTPLESEQSSTESEDNEVDRSENGDEEQEQSDGSDMDIDEDIPVRSIENPDENVGDDSGPANDAEHNNHYMHLEEKKAIEPSPTLPDDVFSPPKFSPKREVKEQPKECSSPKSEVDEKMNVEAEGAAGNIAEANEDIPMQDIILEQPLDKIDVIELMRICLSATYKTCLYCNHARRIAVNAHNFALHLISDHRFSATVDSITAEELQPQTIVQKVKSFLTELDNVFFNLETYGGGSRETLKPYEKIFECYQCRFETRIHKELYLHNRKMHLKTAILCFMCRSNFFSYSEILCHMCPGVANKFVIFDIKFRCCLCDLDNIPSAFRLMVHLRKKHFACDVCLEDCYDQSRLSSHVWKHKLHHLCYRCGIAYRNKPDITKHLFWKHGTESVLCKRCLQKRWPHVYHFCIPPLSFVCDVCNLSFSRAMALKVHKRLHTGDAPYPCPEDDCEQKFISRKLLLKHTARHNEDPVVAAEIQKKQDEENKAIKPEEADLPESGREEKSQEEVNEKNNREDVKDGDREKKKKRKRSKKGKENVDDLILLPALNLSESDSSDESDDEKAKSEKPTTPVPQVTLSPASGPEPDDDMSNSTGTQIMDIWENFKTFQASQAKSAEKESDDEDETPAAPILHVSQSDHDYCMMFKPISALTKSSSKDDINEIKTCNTNAKEENLSPKKKQKSPRKAQRSGSDSSSSGSSSSSDSSCSCGSNCSCSSSSGSSSDSSSSSDSESSTSEGRRRAAARKAAKHGKKNRSKEGRKSEEIGAHSPKANTSDIVDVVTTDPKLQEIVDPDTIIIESDLETEETDTDEDFYDEHPQKMANQVLAEKRKQLLMQTSLSPSHNFDIVENSRPSTPSIPEEMVKEKKVKIKKKKRDKKGLKNNPVLMKTEDNALSSHTFPSAENNSRLVEELQTSLSRPEVEANIVAMEDDQSSRSSVTHQPIFGGSNVGMPAPISLKDRLSTGSSSDQDGNLKRSKRRRRPNKFYGYSSDDDGAGPALMISGPAAFKPTPPPNLTWRKEDLPAPSSRSSHHKSHKSSTKKSHSATSSTLPPIPPIIIRPSALLSKKPLSVENSAYKPPIVQPIRVPPVPVHHIRPPQHVSPNRSFEESDSSSDDDNRLTIMTTAVKKGGKGSRSKKSNQKYQCPPQQQQPQIVNQPPQPSHAQTEAAPVVLSTPINSKRIPPALLPNPDAARLDYFKRNNIRYPIQPPAGARPAREGESVYCYCRCPYDEVSEMIACDGDDCMIEWFHFECVGILVPPQGKWFCPECRPLYPIEAASNMGNT